MGQALGSRLARVHFVIIIKLMLQVMRCTSHSASYYCDTSRHDRLCCNTLAVIFADHPHPQLATVITADRSLASGDYGAAFWGKSRCREQKPVSWDSSTKLRVMQHHDGGMSPAESSMADHQVSSISEGGSCQ
jgi:hypothetical protein